MWCCNWPVNTTSIRTRSAGSSSRQQFKLGIQRKSLSPLNRTSRFLNIFLNVKHEAGRFFILFNFICALYLIIINRRTFYEEDLTHTYVQIRTGKKKHIYTHTHIQTRTHIRAYTANTTQRQETRTTGTIYIYFFLFVPIPKLSILRENIINSSFINIVLMYSLSIYVQHFYELM